MNQPQLAVPAIDMELVRIRASLPKKLADLSKCDQDNALKLLEDWGDGMKPIKQIYHEALDYLDAATSK